MIRYHMESYYKTKEVDAIICKLLKEPKYQHEGEDFKAGVSAVECELADLATIVEYEELTAMWLTREHRNDYLWVECSNCGFLVENYNAVELGISSTDIKGYKWHACPKCTAKMRMPKEINDDLS